MVASTLKKQLSEDIQRLADNATTEVERATRIRTANQRLTDALNAPPLQPLVGPLWESPGIAILAGDTGIGKSVLAVWIAHLITSDTPELLGLRCAVQEKVLYYDFELTDRQFEKRFYNFPFSDLLLTGDTNPAALDVEEFTFDHMEADCDRTGAKIIVLDNITALTMKSTADADVSMGIMRGLKRLQIERGVCCLVLAHTPKLLPGSPLTLNHLAGSKHLSNFADSVFFLGRSVQGPHTRYIKQVKNRTSELLPDVLVCEINDEAGYLGFKLIGTEEETLHLATPAEDAPTTARKAPLAEVQQELAVALIQPQPAGQLEAQLSDRFATDARTIRKRLKELTDGNGYLLSQSGQVCTLQKEQHGREIWYSLLPIPAAA